MIKKHKFPLSAITGTILCILLVPIILMNIILITRTYLNPDELPGIFGVKPAIVLSGSMEPAIHTGDLIFIHETEPSMLREGDVICYLTSGKAVTHRIMDITAGEDGLPRYVTQGDANNTADRLAVSAGQIEGIWKGGRIGGLGNVILFIQTPVGMILFIFCPLLLFILWDIRQRRRLDKADAARTARLEAELEELRSGQAAARREPETKKE